MICLIQRANQASVNIDGETVGKINQGLMVLAAFQPHDNEDTLARMRHKLLHYRVFADNEGKMDLNIQQINGGLLIVPQFTLAANTQKGLRPSFSRCAEPTVAKSLFDHFIKEVTNHHHKPQCGVFGADMQVSLTNDGPVTFWLEN